MESTHSFIPPNLGNVGCSLCYRNTHSNSKQVANQVLSFVFLKQFLETGTPIKPKRTPIKPWPLKLIIKFELQGRILLHLAWSNWWDSQHTNSCLQNFSLQSLSSFSIFLTCFINSNMGKGSKSFIICFLSKSFKGSCTSLWICGCSILALTYCYIQFLLRGLTSSALPQSWNSKSCSFPILSGTFPSNHFLC